MDIDHESVANPFPAAQVTHDHTEGSVALADLSDACVFSWALTEAVSGRAWLVAHQRSTLPSTCTACPWRDCKLLEVA